MKVNNKKVILTGAADGIGKELAKILINKGCTVYGLDINGENLVKLKRELNTDKFIPYTIDVSKKENLDGFKKWLLDNHGSVDILINNAGVVQPFINVNELEDDMINRVMNINFFAPLNMCRLFIDDLVKSEEEGFIVNVSSMAGFFPFPGQSIYGASKAALKIFTEGLYAELSKTKVKTMIVLPGAIHTNILGNSGVKYKDMDTSEAEQNNSYKMTEADDAARQIINGIEKNKFRIFVGSDAKFMNMLYKLNSKKAIEFINKKMG